ncbi:MAG: GntR family transcriptional regulator [Bacteroidetes bacterium]|nr:GntR family transcriptional regulator [Bacteroidota bacterium]
MTTLIPGRPRHEQISDWIRKEIVEGRLETDAQLPSEAELGRQFEVSRITVRRALATLENEGHIYRRQGLGSFVRGTSVEQGLVRLSDFVEDMRQAGLVPTSQVVHTGTERASQEIAAALGVPEGSAVVRLDRLRLGDGEPIAFDQTWLTHFYWQYLDGHDLANCTIYSILEDRYNMPVRRGEFRITAVDCPSGIAGHLAIPKRRAVLLIERTSMADADKRIYFQRRYYRSDRVSYQLELERNPKSRTSPQRGLPLSDFEPVFSNR